MSRTVRVWVDLPPELEVAVRAAGRRDHLNRDEAIVRACERYVAQHTRAGQSAETPEPPQRLTRGLARMALVREGR